jgi:NADPH2:quinone reductase
MTKAIRIHKQGGPEVLQWEDIELGAPGPKEIRLRHTAIGLNFIDIYQRSGLYPMALPTILGTEGAGVVEALGSEVTDLKIGQRVAYAGVGQSGAYAEARLIPAEAVVPLPDAIDDKTAAAVMVKGLTAHMLLFKVHPVRKGETLLVHAAAGGVGTILSQWAKHLGCTVIGTAGSDDKAKRAKSQGCDHVIVYSRENFVERVKEITQGYGVSVVYDGVGKDTFMGSLDCLIPFGHMVTYGNASGPVQAIEPLLLMQKGSLTLSRPTLSTYTADLAVRRKAAEDLFDVIAKGAVKIEIEQTYPLKDTARAHSDLAARKTTGSTVLIP